MEINHRTQAECPQYPDARTLPFAWFCATYYTRPHPPGALTTSHGGHTQNTRAAIRLTTARQTTTGEGYGSLVLQDCDSAGAVHLRSMVLADRRAARAAHIDAAFATLEECVADAQKNGFRGAIDRDSAQTHPAAITADDVGDLVLQGQNEERIA